MNIDELAIKNNTDKSSLDHNYTVFYQKYFDKYFNNPKKILTDFMLEDEIKYLGDNISEMYLETANNSEIAFIIKK